MHAITLLMTAATVTLAGIGGLYYAFACSVMPGLRATDDGTFVSAMSRINGAIQNPVFALGFFGAFFSLAGAAVCSLANGLASALPVSLAWAFYNATLFITFRMNIPLNNRLAQAAGSEQAPARRAFEQMWTRWNLHRAWLSLASLVALSAGWAELGHSG
jgi:uncharacterized membrane protein